MNQAMPPHRRRSKVAARRVAAALLAVAVTGCAARGSEPLALVPVEAVPTVPDAASTVEIEPRTGTWPAAGDRSDREVGAIPGSVVPWGWTAVDPTTATEAPGLAAAAVPFEMDLYRRGDFVRQYTFEWCVGASIQMTENLVRPGADRTRLRQQRHWELARDLTVSPYGGANPRGWTDALNRLDVGPYELISVPDLDGALRAAARAMRETKRPVGLVMWRGRHAWVMSGFTSLGDPGRDPSATITGIRVLDPLYPHGSRTWGPSPKPNALLAPAVLARQYVPRLRGRVDLGVPPGYLLIVPRPAG